MMWVLFLLLQLMSGSTTVSEQKHTLYFLSMLPYYIDEFPPEHQPAYIDGPRMLPALYLAVDQINNRSDILEKYKIELIESNGGCDLDSVTIVSFVSNVFHGNKQIVGIIGPGCADGVRALSTLTHREEVSLVHIHIANSPLFPNANQSHHKNSFSTFSAHVRTAFAESFVAIVKENGWSRFGIFSEGSLNSAKEFEIRIADYVHEVTFFAHVTESYLPVEKARNSITRVILVFTNPDISRMLACLAFHNNITYPTYQWIFSANYTYEETTVNYRGVNYTCSGNQLILEGSTSIDYRPTPDTNRFKTRTVSGLNYYEYLDMYTTYSKWYNNKFGYNETIVAWANPVYDATWALALALNNSEAELEKQNLSLSDYWYGHEEITRVIREEMFKLNFQGITNRIHFEHEGGYNDHPPRLDIFQVVQGNAEHVGLFNRSLVDNGNGNYISDSFPEVEKSIHIVLALGSAMCAGFTLMLTVPAHVLNTHCRHRRSVKASSPRVNHFAFIGCYLLIAAIVIETLIKATSLNDAVVRVFCNFVPWLYNIGLVLVLATVCVKTWRLYTIFALSLQNVKVSDKYIVKDKFVMVMVAVLSLVPVIICMLWSIIHPFDVKRKSDIQYDNGEPVYIYIEKVCGSRSGIYWQLALIVYEMFLIGASVVLALFTQKLRDMEMFKTRNVSILAYLLALTMGLCVPTYIVAVQLELSISVQYSVLAVWLEAVVYLCIVCLFVPPLLPVLKEYIWVNSIRGKLSG